jgi:hypothetical protein
MASRRQSCSQATSRATRLSATERLGYTAQCRQTWKNAPHHIQSSHTTGAALERDVEQVCDCFVDRLEERTSRLQFLMAMQVVRSAGSAFSAPPEFRKLAAAAEKIGISTSRFDELAKEARREGGTAILQCAERMAMSR